MSDFFSKYKKFFVYIFIIPVFWVSSSLSAYAYTGDGATVFPVIWHDAPKLYVYSSTDNSVLFSGSANLATNQNAYFSSSPLLSSVGSFMFSNSTSQIDFNFAPDLYDYYIISTVIGLASSPEQFNFVPSGCYLAYVNDLSNFQSVKLLNPRVYTHSDIDTLGFTFIGKIPDSVNTCFYGIGFGGSQYGGLGSGLRYEGFIVAFPKGSIVGVNDIVSAVNNQTSFIGGKLDNTNDLINNGNSSTGSVVGGFQDSESEFDNVITEYRNVEQTFFDDFRSNQLAISSDITGWSWGGLINCADWVGDTVTDYYNNMGDFRQFIIYPLMLGIALFFLGRGSSIIGHLYRKPSETHTYTVSRSFRDADGSKHTSTTTFRSGGSRR